MPRRHNPERAAGDAGPAQQELAPQHERQDNTEHRVEADAAEQREVAFMAEPIAHRANYRSRHLRGISRSSKHADLALPERAFGERLDGALKVREHPSQFISGGMPSSPTSAAISSRIRKPKWPITAAVDDFVPPPIRSLAYKYRPVASRTRRAPPP